MIQKKKKLWHRTENWWTLQRNHQCIMTENCKWLVSTVLSNYCLNLTFIGPCIVTYSCSTTNKMHLFLKLLILVKRPTRFGRSFRPSSGAQNCTYGNMHMSNSSCYLLLAGTKSPLAAGSRSYMTYACCRMCSFELLMMDGKTVRNM